MSPADNPFRVAAATLLREAFEGMPAGQNYTWFVQGKEGIFDALDTVDAERASHSPERESPTLAAHAFHLLFALRNANSYGGGPEPEGTWESSWDRRTATPEEWAELRSEIRWEYETFLRWFEANEDWADDKTVIGALAQLPHMAYHLGAIRQLMRLV